MMTSLIFSAHIELGFETGHHFREIFVQSNAWQKKNELTNTLLIKSLRIWTVNFTREGIILIFFYVSSTMLSGDFCLQWVLKHNWDLSE